MVGRQNPIERTPVAGDPGEAPAAQRLSVADALAASCTALGAGDVPLLDGRSTGLDFGPGAAAVVILDADRPPLEQTLLRGYCGAPEEYK